MPGVGAGLVRAPAVGKRDRHIRPAPVREHGPELDDVERDAVPADPLLRKNTPGPRFILTMSVISTRTGAITNSRRTAASRSRHGFHRRTYTAVMFLTS